LPLKIDFTRATTLKLDNKEKITTENAKLIWKPFYKIAFDLKYTRTLPNKERKSIEDSGFYVVDGMSGDILKQSEGLKNTINKIFGQSEDVSRQIKENDIILNDLEQEPEDQVSLDASSEYKTIPLMPAVKEEKALKKVLDQIVKINTETVGYSLKRDGLFDEPREYVMIPSIRDIRVKKVELVFIPRWDIEFESKEYKYYRKLSGNSGKLIYDTITYCTDHLLTGFFDQKNIAVCDTCGIVLCKEHIYKCPVCKVWHCENHSVQCKSCNNRFCPDHITAHCSECKSAVCEECVLRCPTCGETHCKTHMTKCSKCNKVVCVSCTRKEGNFLIKKTICKECR
jgi:chaperonin cofactor prefoldin